MARRKKKRTYSAATQARRLARAVIGRPPAERVLPSKKNKQAKHRKRDLEREMSG